ncbi:MAG: hypothetical protein JO250_21610 [Armatimonadetes bacterium]|nr:hypothetical protein [Armatimonadota bacterium]
MRRSAPLLLAGLCLAAPALTPRAGADAPAPVTVSITKPLTPISDVLAALARQTGQTILTDDTVVAPVGVADLSAPTLDAMLDSLKALDSGLTWQKVYLPKGIPLPTGNDLSAQVRTLKTVAASGLVIADTAATVSFSRKKADAAPPADMRLVYLVTDEAVRAQRAAAKTEAAKPKPTTPVDQTASGMQSVASAFSQMTPDQQRQALPQMFQQFGSILQNMDPSLRAQMRQGIRAWMRGGGSQGGNGGGFGNGQ